MPDFRFALCESLLVLLISQVLSLLPENPQPGAKRSGDLQEPPKYVTSRGVTKEEPHTITEHDGILGVEPEAGGQRVSIAYDPSKLGEEDLRRITRAHLTSAMETAAPGIRRWVMRLDGQACEAASAKLEKRIEAVPGVRRASATYIGQVLCLTFDAGVAEGGAVLEGIRGAGARVSPLGAGPAGGGSLWERVRSGDLNEEIACGLGLVCLVAAAVAGHTGAGGALAGWLYFGAYVFGGQQGVRSAVASLREKTLDIDLLMVLAALGAAAVGAPFEGALLLFLFSFSNVLQRHALDRTRRAIGALLSLRPDKALRKNASGTEMVPIESLRVGDIVLVRPGELLPVDGVVAEGGGYVDESSLTGESMPVGKSTSSPVFAGTLNQSGALEVRVTRPSGDSTLAKMVRLVAEAQAEKSSAQRFLEKAEQRYAAGVIAFTALVFLLPWLVWHESFDTAFLRAMTVMVVASPCALVISTPATVLSAIGGAARRGILIKGGSHLETAARVDIVCFDKTGTLTAGRPGLTDIVTAEGTEPVHGGSPGAAAREFLRVCAALEEKSEHPLAAAIVAATHTPGIPRAAATAFQSLPGRGAEAEVEGVRYLVGSRRFLAELETAAMDSFQPHVAALESDGKTCIWLARREGGDAVRALAVFALADTPRPESRAIAAALHAVGVKKIVMLTGDQPAVAAAIARETGIDEFLAGLLPEDKVEAVRRLKREGTVMMVGDGVNDAPALAVAHLGAAMGAAGTDVAMETADVVLMGDKLENIPILLGMARHAKTVLTQNLTFASAVILVLVAAALGFALPLPAGVVGHEGSTVLVCLNGLRLLVYKPPKKGQAPAA
jgi:Zn2+/Cd2+-exporting ATPase